jgi:hypothetical protein
MYIQLGAARRRLNGAGRELKAPSNQSFVGEHMTMDGK